MGRKKTEQVAKRIGTTKKRGGGSYRQGGGAEREQGLGEGRDINVGDIAGGVISLGPSVLEDLSKTGLCKIERRFMGLPGPRKTFDECSEVLEVIVSMAVIGLVPPAHSLYSSVWCGGWRLEGLLGIGRRQKGGKPWARKETELERSYTHTTTLSRERA